MKATTASAVAVMMVAAVGIGAALFWRPERGRAIAEPAETALRPPASAEGPATPPSSAPGTAPAAASAPAAPDPAPADEASLMARLRGLGPSNTAQTIALAREGNRRFPDSADAPERTSLLIHALAAEDRASEARGEAEDMVNHYPDSPWVREVEQFTGAHRHRDVHLEPDGALRFE